AQVRDPAHRIAVEPDDRVLAQQRAEASADAVYLPAAAERAQHAGADDRIQARGVTAAGVQCNSSDGSGARHNHVSGKNALRSTAAVAREATRTARGVSTMNHTSYGWTSRPCRAILQVRSRARPAERGRRFLVIEQGTWLRKRTCVARCGR